MLSDKSVLEILLCRPSQILSYLHVHRESPNANLGYKVRAQIPFFSSMVSDNTFAATCLSAQESDLCLNSGCATYMTLGRSLNSYSLVAFSQERIKQTFRLNVVVHVSNPIYLVGRNRRVTAQGQPRQKLVRLYLKSKLSYSGGGGRRTAARQDRQKHEIV
jgi:hypothetical protein